MFLQICAFLHLKGALAVDVVLSTLFYPWKFFFLSDVCDWLILMVYLPQDLIISHWSIL